MSNKPLNFLVLHCTATEEGRDVTAAEVLQWHTAAPPSGNGWSRAGYNALVRLDGSIETLVPTNGDSVVEPDEIANGARGYNSVSIHLCYVGGLRNGVPADTRTPEQCAAMAAYIRGIKAAVPEVKVVGHNELNPNKSCPCFDVQKWLNDENEY